MPLDILDADGPLPGEPDRQGREALTALSEALGCPPLDYERGTTPTAEVAWEDAIRLSQGVPHSLSIWGGRATLGCQVEVEDGAVRVTGSTPVVDGLAISWEIR